MARSDSFFIRATVATDGLTFAQATLDLGAYVDALGKSVLRIHNVSVQYGTPGSLPLAGNNANSMTAYQLTTQSQTVMVGAADRSVISTGKLVVGTALGGNSSVSDMADLSPADFTNGYLVAVESIFLGTDSVIVAAVDAVSIVLECTVETMTAASAMALALSQQ